MITVFTPTYNRAYIIRKLYKALCGQINKNFEWLVVDDGSTDATKTIATQYQEKDNRFRNYNRPENLPKGPSSARNFGLEKAKGDYVVFLDSDDLLSANCLENRLLFATNFQNFDFWIF